MTEYVRGMCQTRSTSFIRPNDTTAYAVGDVIADSTSAATVLTFPRATLGNGDSGIIAQATIVSSANKSTKLDGRLWLFDTAPASYGNDNEAFAPTDAEMRTVIGIIDFPTASWIAGLVTADAAGNALCDIQNLAIPFNTTKDTNDIYGVLEARNAYTPIAVEQFDIRLKILL